MDSLFCDVCVSKFMLKKEHQMRSDKRLREHYLIEKELANQLRNASKEARKRLYPHLYDELYRLVPDHPQLTRKNSKEAGRVAIERQLMLLRKFLTDDTTFLEVGAGDCGLSIAVSAEVARVYAVDVSQNIMAKTSPKRNLDFVLSDGCSIPVPEKSVDLAYSYQLMEHLHPEDAREQLQNIYKALKKGARYVCQTPNPMNGPHDISQYFDDTACGFHLKEYTAGELCDLFAQAGFTSIHAYFGVKGRYRRISVSAVRCLETVLGGVPAQMRRGIANRLPCRLFMGLPIVAIK